MIIDYQTMKFIEKIPEGARVEKHTNYTLVLPPYGVLLNELELREKIQVAKCNATDKDSSEKIHVMCELTKIPATLHRNRDGWKIHAFNKTLSAEGESPQQCIKRFKELLCKSS